MPLGLVQGDCLAGPALAQRPLTDRLAQSSHVPQRRSRRTATATHRIQRISNRTGSAGIALNHHLPGRCPSRQTIEPATGHAAGKRPREVLRELLAGIVHGTGDAAIAEHQRQRVHGAVVVDGLAVIVLFPHVADHAAVRANHFMADGRFAFGPGLDTLRLLGHARTHHRPHPRRPDSIRACRAHAHDAIDHRPPGGKPWSVPYFPPIFLIHPASNALRSLSIRNR